MSGHDLERPICPCRTASIRSVNLSQRRRGARCSATAAASSIATTKTVSRRRYATRQWICCVLSFKGRQRNVWGRYYTELFFLDEPTALAAGHRPCFECRREEANDFALKFAGRGARASAPAMDDVLHAERLERPRQAIAQAKARRPAGRRVRHAVRRRRLRGEGQAPAALDAVGYTDARPRPKASRCRC